MSNINSFSHLLSIGTICLLIGGTIAAKTVFLVDNDLETQAKLNAANWRLDSDSARKYTEDFQKFSRPYLDSPAERLPFDKLRATLVQSGVVRETSAFAEVRERFSQFSQQSSWCESAREISLVLTQALAEPLPWRIAIESANLPDNWCIQPKVKK